MLGGEDEQGFPFDKAEQLPAPDVVFEMDGGAFHGAEDAAVVVRHGDGPGLAGGIGAAAGGAAGVFDGELEAVDGDFAGAVVFRFLLGLGG